MKKLITKSIEILGNQDSIIWMGGYADRDTLIELFNEIFSVNIYATHRKDTILIYAEDVQLLQESYPDKDYPGAYLLLYGHYLKGLPNIIVLQPSFHKFSKLEKQFCYLHELGHIETFGYFMSPMQLEYMANEWAIKKMKSKKGALKLLSKLFIKFALKKQVGLGLYMRIKNIKEMNINEEEKVSI